MKCPHCGHQTSKVLESREVDEGGAIRRRRSCMACEHRFTTYERVETTHIMIIKKNGNRESFERQKLASGIYKAFEKRPMGAEEIEVLISRIEQQLMGLGRQELHTHEIGEIVMQELLNSDDVAYVRFASVYRSFADLRSFERELRSIRKKSS